MREQRLHILLLVVPVLIAAAGCASTASTTPPAPATASTASLGSTVPGTGSAPRTKLDSGELRSIVLKAIGSAPAAANLTLFTLNEAGSPAVVVIGYVDDKNTGVDVCRAADSYIFSRRPDATIEVDLTGGEPAAKTSAAGYCAQA